jgi:hydroxymethylglutaryl-CoA lyase
LLRVGFDSIDFSFVSPKAIPQMVDTTNDVLAQLDLSQTKSKLLAIIANTRGAELV